MGRQGSTSAAFKNVAAQQDSRNSIGRSLSWLGLLLGLLTIGALIPSTATAAECTNTWVGPAEGTWQTAANWSAGHIPTSTEVACFGTGKTVKVTAGTNQVGVVQGEGTLVLSAGSLELTRSSTENVSRALTLAVSGGALIGIGELDVSGSLSWTSGSMTGTGSTVLLEGASGSVSGVGLAERTFVNKGTLSLSSSYLSLSKGAKLENAGTFTVNAEGSELGILRGTGAAPLIINTGLIRKTSGAGETRIKVKVENRGAIRAETGTLLFPSAEPVTLVSGSSLEGAIKFQGPDISGQSFTMSSGRLTLQNGSLSMEAGYLAEVAELTLNGGTLKGAGELDVGGALSWTAGTMAGTGSTAILKGGSGSISGVSMTERTLINRGTLTLTNYLSMRKTSKLENSGTLTVNAEGPETGITHPAFEPGAVLINTGTLRKTSGSGETLIRANLENLGTVKADTGVFNFAESTAGTLKSGSVLEGSIQFQGPTVTTQSFISTGGTLVISGMSSLSIEKGYTAKVTKLSLNGTLTGSGDLTVTSELSWTGTMSGTGSTTVGPGASGAVAGAYQIQRTLINEGTLTLGSSFISMRYGATIKNLGTFNASTEGSGVGILEGIKEGASPLIVNRGTFQKAKGSGTTEVQPPLENFGVIRELIGHLKILHEVSVGQTNQFGKRCNCGDPVETATGNFSESQTDFAIGGRGVGLVLARNYSAQSAVSGAPGAFGYGWTSSFSDHLTIEESGAKVTLTMGNGSTIPFTRTSGTTYSAPAWSRDSLSGSPEAGYALARANQAEFRFSGTGRLESVVDRNGNETTLSYDEAGRLKAITDPGSRQITLNYNVGGQVEGAKDPMGHVVKYTYEGGNLASVTVPGEENPRWQFKYDASRRMASMTDGRGGKTTNEYDSSNRVISQTDPAGRTLTFKYEAFHTTITNKATGAVTDEWFTSNNEPFSITRGYGTAAATTQTFSYNEAGQLTTDTDGNGHTTTYGYDAEGNRISEKDAAGEETKWTFNGTHDVVSMTTQQGETTTLTRDANGNVESISRAAPEATTQTTTIGYNVYGEPETVTDPLKRTWLYGYNEYGDRTSEADPAGDTQTLAYDGDSRLISLVSPRGNVEGAEPAEYTTTIERDAQGRRRKVIDPLGHTIEYVYDANGNMTARADANGHTTKYVYNADNEPIKTEKPNGDTMETGYDGAGQITSQTNGNKHTTTYVRNVLEQPVELIDPLGRKTTEEFDAAGNLKAVVDAAERKASYAYDATNRLIEVNYSEEATPDVEFGYDADGNLTSMLDGTGGSSYSYDQLGRLTLSEDGHGDVVGYGYDLAEELTGISYPNGKSISRTFDPAGRLASVTDWLGGKTTFAYNADSGLEDIAFPAGSGNVDEFAYDRIDRISEAKFTKGAETLASLSYGRDNAGQVVSDLSEGLPGPEELAYGYDANSRLTTAGEASYEYNASDNMTKAPGTKNTYDAASQLEAGTGILYSYDKLGNRIQATPSGGPATSYAYDQVGNLTSVKRPEEGEVPAIAESFAYNGIGLMASRASGLATHYMTWDCNAPLPLMLSDGQNSYIYGPGGLPIEQISAGESPTYLHHDQLGSTRMLTSPGGEAVAAFTYGPYGQLEGQTGTGTTPMGFAGQYTDAQSGLQYLRARFYDPSTAQFMTLDPILPLTRSPYDYARDNPLNRVDPRGLCGVGSVSDVLESFNPVSEENCAYQGAEGLNDATGVDLPGTLSQPEVVEAGAVATCLAPVADIVCGGALTFSFINSSAGVVHEGIETHFCDTPHLAAEEGVNALMFGFGGLSLKTAGMMAGAPLAAKATARGGPAAAQGLLDGAEGQHK